MLQEHEAPGSCVSRCQRRLGMGRLARTGFTTPQLSARGWRERGRCALLIISCCFSRVRQIDKLWLKINPVPAWPPFTFTLNEELEMPKEREADCFSPVCGSGRAAGIAAPHGRRDQLEGDGAADPARAPQERGMRREQSCSRESGSKPVAEEGGELCAPGTRWHKRERKRGAPVFLVDR